MAVPVGYATTPRHYLRGAERRLHRESSLSGKAVCGRAMVAHRVSCEDDSVRELLCRQCFERQAGRFVRDILR